jgi:hypothetical protein
LAQQVVKPPPPPLERRPLQSPPLRIAATRQPLNEKDCAGSNNKPLLGNTPRANGEPAARSRLRLELDRQSKSIDGTHQEEVVSYCSNPQPVFGAPVESAAPAPTFAFGRTSTETPTRIAPALWRNVVGWKVVGRPAHSEHQQRRPLEEQRHQPQTCPAVTPEALALR